MFFNLKLHHRTQVEVWTLSVQQNSIQNKKLAEILKYMALAVKISSTLNHLALFLRE